MAKVIYYPFSSFQSVLQAYAEATNTPITCDPVDLNRGGEMYRAKAPGVIFTGNSGSPVIHARRKNMSIKSGFPLDKHMAGVLRSV